MSSLQMRLIGTYLRLTAKPGMATTERARQQIAAPKKASSIPSALARRHEVSARQVAGFPCYTVTPRAKPATRAAIYLHGGAYIAGLSPQHWALISRLADAGVRVEVPDYGLAPQHTHRDAYPFVTEVYRQLLSEVDSSTVTIAGDSAGGGLALGFVQSLADAGLVQPARVLLIAPWLDATLTNPELPAAEAQDPWLSSVGLIEAGRAWAGEDDPSDQRVSPINGPISGLAPVHVYIGTRDLLYPDVRLLRRRAIQAGAPLEVTVCEGAVHVYPLVPAPEGRAAARAILEEIAR